ncbi:hypothetical protein BEL05_01665 [Shewanella colwelliana]|uniref:DUF3630 domain-containing protein n=1 Tax=Shewanella colwelliana TaxID=23 RepID=A0A1E5IW65_SHECO|nr:DUF3630 family protein [Shewanella colwelliana]OEG74790.1 hypothetical protein BEL05_01665 [Shewanella colwelliana]GIU42568.1 DUF3630 domain-containing protein [Shewanella colwelliana]
MKCLLDAASKSLSIRDTIDFDRFELFAEPLVLSLDCRIIERHWGADRHQWLLEFEGTLLQLNYEFYGDSCWLSVERSEDVEVLEYLETLLSQSRLSKAL